MLDSRLILSLTHDIVLWNEITENINDLAL